jgi:AcrR family transcriptional regulator
VPEAFRRRVLVAALDELTRWGIERFSIEALTERHAIDEATVYQHWGDRQTLVLDVLDYWSDSRIQTPDTGSLRGDLEALAVGVVDYANTELGRRLLRGMVMDDHSSYGDETRILYWKARFGAMRGILDHAAERGELRPGVNSLASMQILLAPINIRALYTDIPVETEYGIQIADLAWRALARTGEPIGPGADR